MKKFGIGAASILVALLLAVFGFAGCKKKPASEPPPDGPSSGQTKPPTGDDGGFVFVPDEQKKSSVVFQLSNPTDEAAYLRLTGAYVMIGGTDAPRGESVQLRLDRSPEPNGTTMSYKFELKNGESIGKWITPFDLSVTHPSNLVVASFRYYRLTVETYNVRIDEIVFIGEELSEGEGTGQYRAIPVIVYSATPAEGETEEEALRRAGALVDRQNASYEQIKKLIDGDREENESEAPNEPEHEIESEE